jgi:hypothetical protein
MNLRLDASIRGLLGLSLGTLIGRTDSPARGIPTITVMIMIKFTFYDSLHLSATLF